MQKKHAKETCKRNMQKKHAKETCNRYRCDGCRSKPAFFCFSWIVAERGSFALPDKDLDKSTRELAIFVESINTEMLAKTRKSG